MQYSHQKEHVILEDDITYNGFIIFNSVLISRSYLRLIQLGSWIWVYNSLCLLAKFSDYCL